LSLTIIIITTRNQNQRKYFNLPGNATRLILKRKDVETSFHVACLNINLEIIEQSKGNLSKLCNRLRYFFTFITESALADLKAFSFSTLFKVKIVLQSVTFFYYIAFLMMSV